GTGRSYRGCMADAVLAELRSGLPDGALLDDPDVVTGYARDMAMFAPSEQPRCVVFAADVTQVQHVVRVAAAHRVPVVPRGAGSGLAGSSNGVAGYDLARLFVGAEGTLGVITQATLALRPVPAAPVTLVATFPSTVTAGRAVSAVVLAGLVPSLMEIMDRTCIRAVDEWKNLGLDRDAHTLLLCQSDSGGPRGAEEIA